ncbi:hypothetical protein ElyMa_003405000 [Elysia marginata]|uniref:Uncharacterized protein n=1 Tax=Elysia marginata TaxID=1093978 RepID=A0AAV4JSY1_9GAST|nr:hypothetical protein ElyMa_003405000 [Elysia marginata]
MRYVHSIIKIRWQDCITTPEVLKCAKSSSIESMPTNFHGWGLLLEWRSWGCSNARCIVNSELARGTSPPKAAIQRHGNCKHPLKWRASDHEAVTKYIVRKSSMLEVHSSMENRHRFASKVITTEAF